jgi:hypothetical protein
LATGRIFKIVSTESRLLTKSDKQTLVETVYKKIEGADIWIPFHEVQTYFSGELKGWNKKYISKGK